MFLREDETMYELNKQTKTQTNEVLKAAIAVSNSNSCLKFDLNKEVLKAAIAVPSS
jgi:hypothetical protein